MDCRTARILAAGLLAPALLLWSGCAVTVTDAGGRAASGPGGDTGDGTDEFTPVDDGTDGPIPFTPADGDGDDGAAGSTILLDGAMVEFLAEGDALMLLSEDSGVGSAAFFGYDDGQEVIPRLMISELDGQRFEVVMDLEGRMARATVGNLAADCSHNADGSFDLTVSDDEGVRFTWTAILPSTAKMVTTGLQPIDPGLDLCATSLILSEVDRLNPDANPWSPECYTNQDTVLFVYARAACRVGQGIAARLEEVEDACPRQDDSVSCVARVAPWLTSMINARAEVKASVARGVEAITRCTPPSAGGVCCNDVDDSTFGASWADTVLSTDDDGDGVVRGRDLCKDTPSGEPVNAFGCSISQIGALKCEDVIALGDICVRDGCCEDYCFPPLAPFDPDCTNQEICETDQTFCCADARECEVDCPQYDPDCDDPELACAVNVVINCSADGCCQPGCRDPFDPDCTNARLCEFWETACCADGIICTEDCPEPDPDCDEEPAEPPDDGEIPTDEVACCIGKAGAGCLEGYSPDFCASACGIPYQPGVTCDEIVCEEPTTPCCVPIGPGGIGGYSCIFATAHCCSHEGGTLLAEGADCSGCNP